MFMLLRYFSLTSLLALALVGLVLGAFFNRMEHDSLIHLGEKQNIALTRSLSNSIWPSLEGLLDQSMGLTPESLPNHPLMSYLDRMLSGLLANLEVAKVKIYNLRGVTVYSTQASQIGQDQSHNPGFIKSLRGEIATEFVHRRAFPSFDGVIEDRDLISSYVPLSRNGRIHGVFELYYDVTPVMVHRSRIQREMALGVTGLLAVLYIALFFIVRHADRIIKDQHGRLQKYVTEINEINANLEQRISERTETLKDTNEILKEEIIERQLAQLELKKLSRAVEQSPVSVLITDIQGKIDYVNPKFCEVTGFTFDEVRGQNPSILKSGEMPTEVYDTLWQTITSGHHWRGEFHNRRKNGELFWESVVISPIRNQWDKVTHFIAVKEDITARKQSEEFLRQSELRLRTIMENVVEGIVTVSERGLIETANSAMERIFGYAPGEMIGINVRELVPPPHKEKHQEYIERYLAMHVRTHQGLPKAISGELFFEREVQGEKRDGGPFPMELTISHVRSTGEGAFIATVRDITERKKAERELAEARQKYYHQEKMASIGTLAAGIVHEIGNPIAALSGLLEALQDNLDPNGEENRELVDLASAQVVRLTGIIQDVREFSVPQNEDQQLLDLNGLIARSARLMRFDRRLRTINLLLDLDPGLPALYGSDNQLGQVLINLMINAADAFEGVAEEEREERKRQIRISTSFREGSVHIVVADNASGMDEKTLQQAFDAFFTTKPLGKGTGLGLSLCYSIITGHGGEMTLASTPGIGTEVTIRLPPAVTDIP
ncbi:MAG: PAS domain S-box protein [Magnetococcales bacterium]|nr:PAS domain S-box protein [Magnetococcales bacterium]MBF0156288.1 PAS domain S-box protein [Magnetococcales bacterium]